MVVGVRPLEVAGRDPHLLHDGERCLHGGDVFVGDVFDDRGHGGRLDEKA
ncbi:hypothetical protein LP418_27540 [Nocardioides sp. B-3]|nr:hypothetical protein [Nocardioides sp. B-3]UUZ59485.1 hypothetical protein LP418_27540 [Nocardioides sp. B-3]